MGFYYDTLKRFAEAGGNRLIESGEDRREDSVALTNEECRWALQGNPPPNLCHREIVALNHRWIVTVKGNTVVVTDAEAKDFDPEI